MGDALWRTAERRDKVPLSPASSGLQVRHPLGYFGPNQPGTSQEVFLVACNPFFYKHLQWRRGESNPRHFIKIGLNMANNAGNQLVYHVVYHRIALPE